MTEESLERRLDFLWERICAQEALITFLLGRLAAKDDDTSNEIEVWLRDIATGNGEKEIEDVTLRHLSEPVFDHIARLLVAAATKLDPPLDVPTEAARRAERIRQY